jgi:hypothetical protein
MKLVIKGSGFTKQIFREVETITYGAILYFRDVKYDKEDGLVILPVDRFERVEVKGGCLRALCRNRTIRGGDRIPADIMIRNVIQCEITDNSPAYLNNVTVLFGVQVRGNRIFAGSVEEDSRHGECYGIEIVVSDIDLEIVDRMC